MRAFLFCITLAACTAKGYVHWDQLVSSSFKRFLLHHSHGLTSSQQSQIQNGFNAAKHLADKIDKLDFGGVTGALVGSISSFLGALGPFVGLVLGLFGSDAAELQLLKKLFADVENRFDQIDVQFAQIRRQVAFVPTQVHFTDLEANINAVQLELNTLSKVTNTAGYKYEAGEFKKTFDRTYESSGSKLYNGIVHGGLTTGGIFHEFMVYSTYDRKATQRFMLGTLKSLMRAAALEMTYARLNNDQNQAIKSRDWQSRFTKIKNKMIAIDNEIVRNYHNQMVSDVNTFASQYPKGTLSNKDFTNRLYSKITAKIKDTDLQNGRMFRSFIGRPDLKCHYVYVNSNDGYSRLPDSARNHCTTYAAAGVMCIHDDIDLHAATNRYKGYGSHGANRAYLFG